MIDSPHAGAPPAAAGEAATPALEGEALKDAVIKQVEYYLSRQNLANDYYLVSRMNADLFVPIEVIANMPKMKAFSVDVAYIANALKGSTQVLVDEKGQLVKPTQVKLTRSTIIIRDVPADVTKEEITALFTPAVCGPVSNVRPEVGETWFVQLEDEEHARKAYEHITSQQLRGQPVHARVKSENLLRSIPAGFSTGQQAADGFGRGGYVPRGGNPYGGGPGFGGFAGGRGYGGTYDPNAPMSQGEYRGRGGAQSGGYRGGRGGARADYVPGNNGAGAVNSNNGQAVPLGAPPQGVQGGRRESTDGGQGQQRQGGGQQHGGPRGGEDFRRSRGGAQGGNRTGPGGAGGPRKSNSNNNNGSLRQGGGTHGGAPVAPNGVPAGALAVPPVVAGVAGGIPLTGQPSAPAATAPVVEKKAPATPPPQLGPMNFPPLPSKGTSTPTPVSPAEVHVAPGDASADASVSVSVPVPAVVAAPAPVHVAPHHDGPRFSDVVAAHVHAPHHAHVSHSHSHSPSPSPATVAVSSPSPAVASPVPTSVVAASVSAPVAAAAAAATTLPSPAGVASSLSSETAHADAQAQNAGEHQRASPGLRSWSAVVAPKPDAPKKP